MNILIPMAGAGSRFEQAGYTDPKPLIKVKDKMMIQQVVDTMNIDANYVFVVQKSHYERYSLWNVLNHLVAPGCKIVQVDGVTEGAACTTLLAKEHINNDEPLIVSNSDHFMEWDSQGFLEAVKDVDCGILTFEATGSKWSFVRLGEDGLVDLVAEKDPISSIATAGIYYWKKGSDYVKYAEQMIENNTRINGEFYVCPVFNEAIADGKKIKTFEAKKMWGLGTPEDLEYFLKHHVSDSS